MLTGVHPFVVSGAGVPVDLASRRIAPVPTQIGLDRDRWDAFFSQALAPEARERPASARALVAAFEAAI
jgi:hypothetical protein